MYDNDQLNVLNQESYCVRLILTILFWIREFFSDRGDQ